MLKIKVLPAGCGDCILISFGEEKDIKNILIDGGLGNIYPRILQQEIKDIKLAEQHIDLLVITHSHTDHINGIIKFIEDDENNDCIKKVWFNSGVHFDREKVEMLTQYSGLNISAPRIKYLEDELLGMKFMEKNIWNSELIKQGHVEKLHNATLTVLSPDNEGLDKLKIFTKEHRSTNIARNLDYDFSTKIADFKLDEFIEDKSIENSTSISFMFEYDKKKILLLGDSFPRTVVDGLIQTKILDKDNTVDYVKLSHHASRGNLNDDLLEYIYCSNYIVSTHGDCTSKLPNKETFARIVKHFDSINLFFNYENSILDKIFEKDKLVTDDYKINIVYLPKQNYEIEL
jgi:beta-lactamase superfamily II metal-dependent hydrolase